MGRSCIKARKSVLIIPKAFRPRYSESISEKGTCEGENEVESLRDLVLKTLKYALLRDPPFTCHLAFTCG